MDKDIHSLSWALELGTYVSSGGREHVISSEGGATGSAAPTLSPASLSLSEPGSPRLEVSDAGSRSGAKPGWMRGQSSPTLGLPCLQACWESMLVLQGSNLRWLGISAKHPQLPLIITVTLPPLKLSKPSLNQFLFASLPSLGWINSRCLQLPGQSTASCFPHTQSIPF